MKENFLHLVVGLGICSTCLALTFTSSSKLQSPKRDLNRCSRPAQCSLGASSNSLVEFEEKRRRRKCGPCPEPSSDFDVDRREAAYAMLGSIWSAGAIPVLFEPQAARATYGEDAKIMLPNIVEGMSDRVSKQCLVESLGNRECLLYLDPANKIYQGADNQILFDRLEQSTKALATLPELIEAKNGARSSE